jgi:hypothetical protein
MKYDTLFPMNNLKKLNQLEAEQSSRAGLIKYGSKVPLTMDILERLDPLSYLLQMNGKKAFAESEKLLEPGMKYWGEATHKRGEKFVIKNLIKEPAFFRQVQDNAFVDAKKVLEAFSSNSKTPFEAKFKQEIISQMANSSSREEFIFLNQLLLSMENQVISIPITYEDRSALFQYKYGREKKKKEEDGVKTLDFYALFETLGPMKGKLIYYQDGISVNVEVNFEASKEFLMRNIVTNSSIKDMEIVVKVVESEIQPLYSFTQNNLLDLRT